MLLFSLLLLCAGCGVTSTSPATSTLFSTPTTAVSSSHSATTPTAPGHPVMTTTASPLAQNGCPAKQPPANAGTQRVDVVAPQAPSEGSAQPVTLRLGQVVEIELTPAFHWNIPTGDSAHRLTADAGNGWLSAPGNQCVWRYTATKTGTTTLTFTGTRVCATGGPCPTLALVAEFTFTIQP